MEVIAVIGALYLLGVLAIRAGEVFIGFKLLKKFLRWLN